MEIDKIEMVGKKDFVGNKVDLIGRSVGNGVGERVGNAVNEGANVVMEIGVLVTGVVEVAHAASKIDIKMMNDKMCFIDASVNQSVFFIDATIETNIPTPAKIKT